jgi:Flp pilus assembly protein TadB
LPDSEKTGKTPNKRKRFGGLFQRRDSDDRERENNPLENSDSELVIEQDRGTVSRRSQTKADASIGWIHKKSASKEKKNKAQADQISTLNSVQRFAYRHLSPSLPTLPGYREAYEQAGFPLIYESYLSTAFFLSFIASIPAFTVSLLVESQLLKIPIIVAAMASVILALVAFAVSLLIWLLYPLERRRSFKSKLERQMAYSFGILGALAAAGIGVERLFERLAATETNPVLAELSRRFLRDVKVFGLDTETALREVATHSPSLAFSKMLESMAVAFRTTGSLHDLVMYESARLFAEKKDKLKKNVNDLAVMSELYITLVVVGPIIFIVMLTIFIFLPSTGGLPSPTILINILVFIGIPAISVAFTLLLDSMASRM